MSAIIIEPDPVKMEQPALPQADPCVVVIFGSTGDLTKRKLMPALFDLCRLGCLEQVRILGIGRHEMSEDEFRKLVHEALSNSDKVDELDEHVWQDFARRIYYNAGELEDEATYQTISTRLEELASSGSSKNRIFYLATPPSLFDEIVSGLGKAGLAKED